MKKSLIFIIIFIKYINAIYACGYYPYGEDIRFSLFGPEYFDYQEFKDFFYNANIIGSNDNPNTYYQSNVYDWYSFINQEVSIDEINECLNYLKFTDIDSSSTNQFVKYLFNNNLHKIIKYLKVAKKSEDFSTVYNADPWERNDSLRRNYSSLLAELNKHIADEEDDYFKRKYAFLCIRSAYYCGSFTLIYNLFHKYFEKGKRDYLYYWASYFNLFNNPHPSVDMANIMAYSTEKRYACYFYFHNQFKLERDLLKAKSSNDLANLYAFASVQRLDPNLEYLKIIYNNCAKSRILDFLLLREINKIEDWVYTPYYTNYLPSTTYSVNWNSNLHYTKLSTEALRARSEKDRLYAKKVLEFINSVNYDKIRDISLWKAAKIQLLFITRKYTDCLKEIEYFERQYSNDRIFKQIEKIKVLCIVSHQKTGTTIINEEVKSIILGNLLDEHFLFAVGRELEYRGNIPDGLALISYIQKRTRQVYDFDNFNFSGWQGNRSKKSGNLVYFSEYFDYLDFVYSADELLKLTSKIESNIIDSFEITIYSQLLADVNYLRDLLGTKFLRENKLLQAAETFKSIEQSYWDEIYNLWERDKDENHVAFDKNPFYVLNYTKPFITSKEIFLVTKLSVTQHLLKYLELADNPRTNDRDYYYFIVGNCYLNMTQYGHSWMMRRFSSNSSSEPSYIDSYIDEIEYRNANLAQKYYHLAYENAKTDKFKALCVRMEEYALNNVDSKYKRLYTTYPEYYNELSTCEFLGEYFKARR